MADSAPDIPFGPGDEIRLARQQAGRMSQQELALVLGVNRDTVGEWERNHTEPTISQWRAIARATGQSWLLGPPIHLISVGCQSETLRLLSTTDKPRLPLELPPATLVPQLTVIGR